MSIDITTEDKGSERSKLMEMHKVERSRSKNNEVMLAGDNAIGPYYKDDNNVLHLDYSKLKPDVNYLLSITITCFLSSMQLGAALSASNSTLESLRV